MFEVCGACGKGSWPHGVAYEHQYIPTDYEKSLEDRIVALENQIALLLPQAADPYDSPEYHAFVEKVAEKCNATNPPCDACLAGGICDGPNQVDTWHDDREYDSEW